MQDRDRQIMTVQSMRQRKVQYVLMVHNGEFVTSEYDMKKKCIEYMLKLYEVNYTF